jgi:hypothetical protein
LKSSDVFDEVENPKEFDFNVVLKVIVKHLKLKEHEN